ncbi:MAG: hypothetical protein GY782_08990 [Gammaproteobacteria bacterium]|nr:hypothetical protein [Gammaproteobacteria bacterium]
MSDKCKRAVSAILRWGLTGFSIIIQAAMSFVGMLALLTGRYIPGRMIVAGFSSLFAVMIESIVLHQNISSGLDYLFAIDRLRHKLARDLIIKHHKQYLKEASTSKKKKRFLEKYAKEYRELSKLLICHDHSKKERINSLKQSLYKRECQLIAYLEEKAYKFTYDLSYFSDETSYYTKQLRRKSWLLRFFHLVNLLSSAGAFFSFVAIIKATFVFIGIAATISSGGIFAIAALATISCFLISYNTIVKVIEDDLCQKFLCDVTKRFRTAWEKRECAKLIGLFFGAVVFIALIVALTLITFGTWWSSGWSGFSLVVGASSLVAKGITMALVCCYTFTTVLFNVKNIGETLALLFGVEKWGQKWDDFIERLEEDYVFPGEALFSKGSLAHDTNNKFLKAVCYFLAGCNYFFIIVVNTGSELFEGASFLLHCLGEGVMFGRSWPADTVTTLAEGGSDMHCVFGESCEHNSESLQLKPLPEPHTHLNIVGPIFCFVFCITLIMPLNMIFYKILTKKSWSDSFHDCIGRHWSSHNHGHGGHGHRYRHKHNHRHHHSISGSSTHPPRNSIDILNGIGGKTHRSNGENKKQHRLSLSHSFHSNISCNSQSLIIDIEGSAGSCFKAERLCYQ